MRISDWSSDVCSSDLPEHANLAAEADGRIYNYDVRIVDADGRDVAPGEEGEILARGPSMFLGYTDWQETMKAVDGNGYFHTGDLVRAGPEGSIRSEEQTSELKSLMRISYAVFCLKKKNTNKKLE